MTARPRLTAWWDSVGVLSAAFAALCCLGLPSLLGVLATLGLSWVRRDSILWPLMFVSLAVALGGFWNDRRRHRSNGPIALAAAGAVGLVAGVVFIHGPPARQSIYGGAIALVMATAWNMWMRRQLRVLTANS